MGKRGQWSAKEWEAYYSSAAWEEQPHGTRHPKPWGKGKSKDGKKPKETFLPHLRGDALQLANQVRRSWERTCDGGIGPSAHQQPRPRWLLEVDPKGRQQPSPLRDEIRKIDEETEDIDAKWTE